MAMGMVYLYMVHLPWPSYEVGLNQNVEICMYSHTSDLGSLFLRELVISNLYIIF